MSDIKWKEGVAFFVGGKQWREHACGDLSYVYSEDFQLNEIQQGDYIPTKELDEQKYNDVVGVFGLFGFKWGKDALSSFNDIMDFPALTICHDGMFATGGVENWCKRKISYSQLMTIGKLKRAMIERGEVLIEAVENTLILKDTLVAAKDNQSVCGKPKEEFVVAVDKVTTLEGVLCTPQATSDCKELNLNLVITGEGSYVLDCINGVEYQVETLDDYNKVIGAIRVLQERGVVYE